MKKSPILVLLLVLIFAVTSLPTFAAVDTTTSPTAPATAPAKPGTPAPNVKGSAETTTTAGAYHTVVSGDMFWKIAKQYNMTIADLTKLNPQVKDISKIYVGQKIAVKASAAKALFHGLGEVPVYRPSKNQLNLTTASVLFDQDGKIVDVNWDVMEITQKLFPGWHDPKAEKATIDAFTASINPLTWLTKRELGYKYDMTRLSTGAATNLSKKEWFEQLNTYESFFKGKTVAEVEAWFKKYTDAAGRPYKMAYPTKLTDADKKVTDTFTAQEKAMLVDVTTSATMSLKDDHSDFITALKEAYAAKREVKF